MRRSDEDLSCAGAKVAVGYEQCSWFFDNECLWPSMDLVDLASPFCAPPSIAGGSSVGWHLACDVRLYLLGSRGEQEQ